MPRGDTKFIFECRKYLFAYRERYPLYLLLKPSLKQIVFTMKEELEHLTLALFYCVSKKKKRSRGKSLFISRGGDEVPIFFWGGEGSHSFQGSGKKISCFQQILKGGNTEKIDYRSGGDHQFTTDPYCRIR